MLKHILSSVNRRLFQVNNTPKILRYSTKESSQTLNDSHTELAEREKKLKILALEIDVLRQDGRKAPNPELIKPANWEYILSLNTKSARQKYYTFLWKNEKMNESQQIKKEIRKQEILQRKEIIKEQNQENDHIIYGLSHNTFFLRIYDTTINFWENNRLINAMLFGQKLVLDLSYDQNMTTRESINAAKQLMLVFAENRHHDNPFDLYFCNANRNGTTMKYLQQHIPTLDEPWFPLNVHNESFMDLFPKERLVYLTPHCKNELQTYSHDDIYIIGAMVDTVNNEPISLGKAKSLGLRMAKLPLDRYLQWGSGSGKSLTLNQMTSILLDQKDTNNWSESLKTVPRRKLVQQKDYNQRSFKPDLDRYKFNLDNWAKPKKK